MRRPVGAGEAGPVEHEHDRQVLQADLLEDLVERPLQERAVDVDDRSAAHLGLPRGKGHRVRLADADVEEAVGEFLAHRLELVALAHGRGEHRHPFVAPHAGADRGAGDVGVGAGG